MERYIKSAAPPSFVAAVQQIEDQADDCYRDLALLRLPVNLASWPVLTIIIHKTECVIAERGMWTPAHAAALMNLSRSVPPMASQPPDTGRDRNQVRPLRSTVSSVRGKADRHRSTGVFWITFCSGLRRISKTSCSISGPTSTTIARIPPWKGERRIGLPHDQSQISASFDGNLTVDPYIRHQWLRDFPKTLELRYPVNLGKTSNSIIWCLRSWLLCASRIRSFHSNRINSPETGRLGARLQN